MKKKQNVSDNEKEKIYDHLVQLTNKFDKKEEHKHSDRNDVYYFELEELENLFGDIDGDNYYKPILFRSSFKKIINIKKYRRQRTKKIVRKGISLCDYAIFSRFNK